MTIIEAIKKAIQFADKPISANEIFDIIDTEKYYTFNAKSPKGVVNGQLRRHCRGIDFPSANPVKHFDLVGSDKYAIRLPSDETQHTPVFFKTDEQIKIPEEILEETYQLYITQIKQELLNTIVNSDPAFF